MPSSCRRFSTAQIGHGILRTQPSHNSPEPPFPPCFCAQGSALFRTPFLHSSRPWPPGGLPRSSRRHGEEGNRKPRRALNSRCRSTFVAVGSGSTVHHSSSGSGNSTLVLLEEAEEDRVPSRVSPTPAQRRSLNSASKRPHRDVCRQVSVTGFKAEFNDLSVFCSVPP